LHDIAIHEAKMKSGDFFNGGLAAMKHRFLK
jgi:hypothetical protein